MCSAVASRARERSSTSSSSASGAVLGTRRAARSAAVRSAGAAAGGRRGPVPVRRFGPALGGGGEDVGPRDAPVATGADDAVRGQPVLVEEPPHDRRQHGAGAAGRPGSGAVACRCRDGRRGRASVAPEVAGSSARTTAASTLAGSAASRVERLVGGRGHDRDRGADRDGVALGDEDRPHEPGHGRRHLGVHLLGGHLEECLVDLDRVADLLAPRRDGPLGDGLTELGHRDLLHRSEP